jgi:hypothetical protein
MKIEHDDLWLCTDCTQAAVNDDYTGLDYHHDFKAAAERAAVIADGLDRLGANLCPGDTSEEFSTRQCDCCNTSLAGYRHQFITLMED